MAAFIALLRDHVLTSKDKDVLNPAKLRKAIADGIARSDLARTLWSLSRIERLGLDGALFGTMVTQHDYRIAAPSAIQVAHSFTVHRVFNFETLEIARDDLEDGPQAAVMLDASYTSGVYYTCVTLDHRQLIENCQRPELEPERRSAEKWVDRLRHRKVEDASETEIGIARAVARAFVISMLRATDHAMKTQTNARVLPCYVLAETTGWQAVNLASAFSTAIRRDEGIAATAIAELRRASDTFDRHYRTAERRAEFCVHWNAPAAPRDWHSTLVHTPEELAAWTAGQIG